MRQIPDNHTMRLARGCALLLAAFFPFAAHAESADPPDDELVQITDEPLDLTTPLPELNRAVSRPKVPTKDLPAPWNAKVGVEYRKSPIPNAEFQPSPWPDAGAVDQTGVAWGNVTASELPIWDQATVETHLDPLDEQTKVGTTLSRSVELGDVAITLRNGYSVSRTFANSALSTQATTPSQSWSSNQALRFNLVPTDTTLSLGANLSSGDEKWLRTLNAEQKLFGGPFSLSGSVSETMSGETSKSLRAGFKQNW